MLAWSFGSASCGPTVAALVAKITPTESEARREEDVSWETPIRLSVMSFWPELHGVTGTERAAGKGGLKLSLNS